MAAHICADCHHSLKPSRFDLRRVIDSLPGEVAAVKQPCSILSAECAAAIPDPAGPRLWWHQRLLRHRRCPAAVPAVARQMPALLPAGGLQHCSSPLGGRCYFLGNQQVPFLAQGQSCSCAGSRAADVAPHTSRWALLSAERMREILSGRWSALTARPAPCSAAKSLCRLLHANLGNA